MLRNVIFFFLLLVCQDIFAQCYPDRHNTTWYDSWISCEASSSPNVLRGESHWLHYDLGHLYKLKTSKFWNANQPDSLHNGLKNIIIDYSLDGINWTEWGTNTLLQATGLNTYEGTAGPDFGEQVARYVLITAVDNYGGDCFSLSEVKIEVEQNTVAIAELTPANFEIYPNPVDTRLQIKLPDNIDKIIYFDLLDASGKQIKSFGISDHKNNNGTIDVQGLPSGLYILNATGGQVIGAVRFFKS